MPNKVKNLTIFFILITITYISAVATYFWAPRYLTPTQNTKIAITDEPPATTNPLPNIKTYNINTATHASNTPPIRPQLTESTNTNIKDYQPINSPVPSPSPSPNPEPIIKSSPLILELMEYFNLKSTESLNVVRQTTKHAQGASWSKMVASYI